MADNPITRKEKYLAKLTGSYTGNVPDPITRVEKYLYDLCQKGISGLTPEEIENAVNKYLKENPVQPGATEEQAQQIKKNTDDVASLKEDIDTITGNTIYKFTTGAYIKTGVSQVDLTPVPDILYAYCIVDCEYGDGFTLTGHGGGSPRLWAFIDENNNMLINSVASEIYENTYLTAPLNAVKAIFNCQIGYKYSLYKNKVINRRLKELTENIDYLKNNTKNVLNGKKICVIGDSITEHNFRAKTNWVNHIVNWTGAIIQNLGISGTGFVASNPYINRISQINSNSDVIGVACSFNDMSSVKNMGMGDIDNVGTDTVYGYLNNFFISLLNSFPTTPIICYLQSPWETYYTCGSEKEYSNLYIDGVKAICEKYMIPFYDDMYYGSQLRPWNDANKNMYYISDDENSSHYGEIDGVHPNSKGHIFIARYLLPKFEEALNE